MKTSDHKPANFDEYIDDQPAKVEPALKKLREIVAKTAPDAEEVISYGMPAYKLHGMLLYFAAFTNHYSLFAFPSAIVAFKDKLKGYETSKGTIKFPLDKPVPVRLITQIVKFKVTENISKHLAKLAQSSGKKKK
jgi:uncharacterized protein YdhG (YjbR/CyaY superfamily)